jgi:hypothetical protein
VKRIRILSEMSVEEQLEEVQSHLATRKNKLLAKIAHSDASSVHRISWSTHSKTLNGENVKEAVIYTRRSSNEQGQARFSLEAQANLVREYALRNNMQVINARVDLVDAVKRLRKNSKKEKREKASRGIYPGCVPFGYRDSSADGTIEVDPVESLIVTRIFELCAAANPCPEFIAKAILDDFGIRVSEENIDVILHDWFYFGVFKWEKRWYAGIHPIFLRPGVFYEAHSILNECNRTGSDTDLADVYPDTSQRRK